MRIALILSLYFALAAPLFADVASGPKEGDKAAELKVFAVTGDPKEKEVNYTELRKDKPTVYVFWRADKKERPIFRFIKTLDEKVGDGSLVVVVLLTDNTDEGKEWLPKIAQHFMNTALTLFGEMAGPKDWGINVDASATAVVVHQGKVIKSFGYQSVNETDAPAVVEALKKATKK